MGGIRTSCFHKRNRFGGQANFQKLRSEYERSVGDNEEYTGIKREEYFSMTAPCPFSSRGTSSGFSDGQ